MQHLRRIGLTFRVMLLQNMGDFMAASVVFKEDYDREGPMVRGIKPSVAEERLKAFQKQYSGASSRASPGRGSRRSRSTCGSLGGGAVDQDGLRAALDGPRGPRRPLPEDAQGAP